MLTYQKLSKKPKRFRSFTGLDVHEFDFLSKKVEEEYEETEKERLTVRKRKRRIGAGRDFNCNGLILDSTSNGGPGVITGNLQSSTSSASWNLSTLASSVPAC